jgi:predicted heme/steroid binding protein
VIVDPKENIAKVYRWQDGRYIQVLDAGKDNVGLVMWF